MTDLRSKRFAVLITGDPSEPTRESYGHYGDLFVSLLKKPSETWDFFDVRKNEFPQDPSQFDGFLITGSASTAHEDLPWILRLKEFIRQLQHQDQKVLGFCFGHQAIAGALGGTTNINSQGWEIGLHSLDWKPEAAGVFPQLPLPSRVLEIHRDHVVTLPPEAEVLASSPQTPVQVYTIGDRILGVQGHPEFFNEIVEDLVISRRDMGIIDTKLANKAIDSFKNRPDRDDWIHWLRAFLDKP